MKVSQNSRYQTQKKVSNSRKTQTKGGTLSHFLTSIVAKHQLKWDPLVKKQFPKKSLTMPKTLKGRPFGEKFVFRKKFQKAERTDRGPFSISRYGMLRGKTGKTFLVQFVDQIVQFGAIIFRRTLKNYFGQFVWIEEESL